MVSKVYFSTTEAAAYTGLSRKYLRSGIKNGTVPAIKSGRVYKINVPKLLEILEKEAQSHAGN